MSNEKLDKEQNKNGNNEVNYRNEILRRRLENQSAVSRESNASLFSQTSTNITDSVSFSDSKNRNFHRAFKNKGIPIDEKLIDRYSCALQRDILLLQGFLYISTNHICYYTNILGLIHQVVLPLSKIKTISKKTTAFVFPNAIQIETNSGQTYFMTSFVSRDSVYNQLMKIWNDFKEKPKSNDNSENFSSHSSLEGDAEKSINDSINENMAHKNNNENKIRQPNSNKINIENETKNNQIKLSHVDRFQNRNKNLINKNQRNNKNNKKFDFMLSQEEEQIQIHTRYPRYIPKVSNLKDLQILKLILCITIIFVGTITFYTFSLRIKTYRILQEMTESNNFKDHYMNEYEKFSDWIDDKNSNVIKEQMAVNQNSNIYLNLNWDEWEMI